MKKTVVMTTILVVLMALTNVVNALTTVNAVATVKVNSQVGTVEAKAGDIVTVTVELDKQVKTGEYTVTYNPDVLTPKTVTPGQDYSNIDTANGSLSVIFTGRSAINTMTITFEVKGAEGATSTVKFAQTGAFSLDTANDETIITTGNEPVVKVVADKPETVAVTEVKVSGANEVEVGASEQLTATVLPEGATNKNVTWSSNNAEVATVDQTGKVTGVKAGTAVITVMTEDGNKTASITITVKAAASTEPDPTEPEPTEPAPTEPAPTEPAPTEPTPTEPAPTEPAPTEPAPTEPEPTEPAPTEPAPTEPEPTEPTPTEPEPTEPEPTEPAPTEPNDPNGDFTTTTPDDNNNNGSTMPDSEGSGDTTQTPSDKPIEEKPTEYPQTGVNVIQISIAVLAVVMFTVIARKAIKEIKK